MVKRTRMDRCFRPAAGGSVARVQFPVSSAQRAPPLASGTGSSGSRPRCSAASMVENIGTERWSHVGGQGPDGGSGEMESKRAKQEGAEEAAVLTSRINLPRSCDPAGETPRPEQQGAAEHSEDSRAAELQSAGSLKVTIQRSSESREFGQTDRMADRQTGGLHCHVCNLTCRSLQVFQEHMTRPEHLRKLQEITNGIRLNTHTYLDRGRRPQPERWCDTCQTHFSGEVIVHRRTKPHKLCKQLCRPFCPVCKRYFRTPRKFVEHMKSEEHKQQVHLDEAQEEELITVDAVGCFEEEEEEEVEVADDEEEEVEVADVEEKQVDEGEEESKETESEVTEEADEGEYDPHVTYGTRFVVPACGFVCRLCNKFFYRKSSARHTHCRTHTHYRNLQRHRAQRIEDEEDT